MRFAFLLPPSLLEGVGIERLSDCCDGLLVPWRCDLQRLARTVKSDSFIVPCSSMGSGVVFSSASSWWLDFSDHTPFFM